MFQIMIRNETGEWDRDFEGGEYAHAEKEEELMESIEHLQKLWPDAEFQISEVTE